MTFSRRSTEKATTRILHRLHESRRNEIALFFFGPVKTRLIYFYYYFVDTRYKDIVKSIDTKKHRIRAIAEEMLSRRNSMLIVSYGITVLRRRYEG